MGFKVIKDDFTQSFNILNSSSLKTLKSLIDHCQFQRYFKLHPISSKYYRVLQKSKSIYKGLKINTFFVCASGIKSIDLRVHAIKIERFQFFPVKRTEGGSNLI